MSKIVLLRFFEKEVFFLVLYFEKKNPRNFAGWQPL
jgi:hypothetical protein